MSAMHNLKPSIQSLLTQIDAPGIALSLASAQVQREAATVIEMLQPSVRTNILSLIAYHF